MPGTPDKIRETFKRFDKNGDGTIDEEELAEVLHKLGNFKDSEVKRIFSHADVNRDGSICVDEFVDWIFSTDRRDAKAKAAMMPDDSLACAFYRNCSVGQEEMDRKGFDRLCKEAQLYDKHFKQEDGAVAFAKVTGQHGSRVSQKQFAQLVDLVALKKGVDREQLHQKIVASAAPAPEAKPERAVDVSGERVMGQLAMGVETKAMNADGVREVFKSFCRERPGLDRQGFVDLAIAAHLVDKVLTAEKLGEIFDDVAVKDQTRIGWQQFQSALGHAANRKGQSILVLEKAILQCGSPPPGNSEEAAQAAQAALAAQAAQASGALLVPVDKAKGQPRAALTAPRTSPGSHRPSVSVAARRPSSRPAAEGSQTDARDALTIIFESFCPVKSGNCEMNKAAFAHLCKGSGLVDKSFQPADSDVVFMQVMQTRKNMDIIGFRKALEAIAKKKGVDVAQLTRDLAARGGGSGGSPAGGIYIRLHDDFRTKVDHSALQDIVG